MQSIDLLVSQTGTQSLSDFAQHLFKLINIDAYELRDSDHVIGGHYFIATIELRTFKVMLSNHRIHRDLPFWVRITVAQDGAQIARTEISEIAAKLERGGYRMAQILDKAKSTERRVDL